MNNTTKNVLKIICVMAGAGLTMVGNIMGNEKKDDVKNDPSAKQK